MIKISNENFNHSGSVYIHVANFQLTQTLRNSLTNEAPSQTEQTKRYESSAAPANKTFRKTALFLKQRRNFSNHPTHQYRGSP